MDNIIYYADMIGTLVFAISGVLAAIEHKFDLVGSFILGFVTAVGGGTVRDVLIGETPVGWMKDMNYFLMVVLAIPICYLARKQVLRLRKSLFLFDTIGIALFTILGFQKTLALGLPPIVAMMMGVVSACFGGVTRDVLANEVPLIFRKEIYASACFAGAVVYYILMQISSWEIINFLMALFTVIIIRYLAVRYRWALAPNPIS